MTLTRRAFSLALPASALSASVLSAGAARAQGENITLTVYNAQHVSLTKAWAEGFTAETGIKTSLRNGNDTELGNLLVQEGAASPADVFLTENSPAIALVEHAGLFATVDPGTLALIQPSFVPSGDKWVGIAARSTVLAYDPRKLTEAQLPASMMDLAEPAWKGRWAAAPAGADFQAIISAMLALKGSDATLAFLRGMKQNVQPYRSNSVAMKAVNAGEVPCAIIYHYYYFGDAARTGENSSQVKLHYFRHQDPGAFVSTSGGGVLASSKQQKAGQAFLAWIAGPKGQAVLRNGDSFEYAVGKNDASNSKLVPLAELQAPSVDADKLNSKAVSDLMTQAGLI